MERRLFFAILGQKINSNIKITPLEFSRWLFGAYENFPNKNFNGSLTGSEPENPGAFDIHKLFTLKKEFAYFRLEKT